MRDDIQTRIENLKKDIEEVSGEKPTFGVAPDCPPEVEEAFLRQEVEAAGFKLIDEGGFLRNPNDPRDKNTPDPPQPKDDFVLKFTKP